jgi:hypothetical protein
MLLAVLIAKTAERQLQRNTSGENRIDAATRKSCPIPAEALRGQTASHALPPSPGPGVSRRVRNSPGTATHG